MPITVSHDLAPSAYGNLALQTGQLNRRDEIRQRVMRAHEQKLARRQAARQAEQARRMAERQAERDARLSMVQMQAKQAEQEAGREFQREMLGLRTRYEQLGYRDKAGVDQQNTIERMRLASAEKQDARLASLAAEEAMLAKKMDANRDQFKWEFTERQKQEMTQYNQNLQRIDDALESGQLSPTEHAEARNQVLRKLVGIKKQPVLSEETPWEPGRGPGETWNTTLPDGTEVIMTRDDRGNVKELSRRDGPDFTKLLDTAIKVSTDENGVVDQEKVKAYMENARAMWRDWSTSPQADAGEAGDPGAPGDMDIADPGMEPEPEFERWEWAETAPAGPVGFAESRQRSMQDERVTDAMREIDESLMSEVDDGGDANTQAQRLYQKRDDLKELRPRYESDEDAELAYELSGNRMPYGPDHWNEEQIKQVRAALNDGDADEVARIVNSLGVPEGMRIEALARLRSLHESGRL